MLFIGRTGRGELMGENGQRPLHANIVKSHGCIVGHADISGWMGSDKENVVPEQSLDATHNRPSCASAIERQIARPIPMPDSLVVKKASNTLSRSRIPMP